MATAFAPSNASFCSRNPWPCTVQPGVEALGYHHIAIHFPARLERLTVLPSWSVAEKSGASLPTESMVGSSFVNSPPATEPADRG